MIVYSHTSSTSPGVVGMLETPIKMIIEHESDFITSQNGICQQLFNIEKSNRFAETIVGTSEFSIFSHNEEGEPSEQDYLLESYTKFIEHIQFMKEFAISAQMMEDANYGVAADAKRRAQNFIRAYYKTINKLCEQVLINGNKESITFANAYVDTTTGDQRPLFDVNHVYNTYGIQSNYYCGDLVRTGTGSGRKYSAETFETALSKLSVIFRNMLDEVGEPLGYTADTIILPANRYELESIVRKVCGSPGALGNGYNDINLHCGNWNIVILPGWQADKDEIMIMSSEANKNLCGNMFFNRVPLTITNWVDNHSGNYIWNGRCRFGVGFGTYKHIMRIEDLEGESATMTKF